MNTSPSASAILGRARTMALPQVDSSCCLNPVLRLIFVPGDTESPIDPTSYVSIIQAPTKVQDTQKSGSRVMRCV